MFKNSCFSLILIFLVLSSYGCGDKAETGVPTETDPARVKMVRVSQVEPQAPRGSVEYVGVLLAFKKVNVASEIGGTIEKLLFEKGDLVKRGHLLAEVSTSRRQKRPWQKPKATIKG